MLICPLIPGWNKQVDYEPGTGSKQLFPKMHLETCGGPLSSVRTTVELQTSHIGKGCDRETYSEKSLQKLCGQFSKKNQSGGGRHYLFFLFNLCCDPSLWRRDQTDERLQRSLAQWEVAVNNSQNAPEAVWPPLDVLNRRRPADQR